MQEVEKNGNRLCYWDNYVVLQSVECADMPNHKCRGVGFLRKEKSKVSNIGRFQYIGNMILSFVVPEMIPML